LLLGGGEAQSALRKNLDQATVEFGNWPRTATAGEALTLRFQAARPRKRQGDDRA